MTILVISKLDKFYFKKTVQNPVEFLTFLRY